MSIKAIIGSLDATLQTVAGLPTLQSENKRVRLGSGKTPWCRSTTIPAQSDIATIGPGGFSRLYGLFQVDLFYPPASGYTDIYGMADLIVDKFIPGRTDGDLKIVNSYISRYIGQRKTSDVENYYTISVTVEWQQYKTRSVI